MPFSGIGKNLNADTRVFVHVSHPSTVFFIGVIAENGRDLFEFPISRTSDYSKVGKKGYLFEFDYETILFTFKNDTGKCMKSIFLSFVLF